MTNFVDLIAYSFLVIAIAVAVLQRLQGKMDTVSFIVARGLLVINQEVHPVNTSEGLLYARNTLDTLNYLSNPNFIFDINKVDVNSNIHEAFLSVRIYNYNVSNEEHLRGVIVWYHGGGWVQGSVEGDDAMCIRMASLSGFVVVSVNYRMAPEFPYPVPVRDAVYALDWIADNIHKYGGDGERLFVCGESAGGNLAAAVIANRITTTISTMNSHDNDNSNYGNINNLVKGTVLGVVLVCPALGNNRPVDSHSRYNLSSGLLTMNQMNWFRLLYSGNNQTLLNDDNENLFAPLYTPSYILKEFPPTLLVLARHDVLLDEGIEFSRALQLVNVPVDVDLYEGTIHGFFGRLIFPMGIASLKSVVEKIMRLADS